MSAIKRAVKGNFSIERCRLRVFLRQWLALRSLAALDLPTKQPQTTPSPVFFIIPLVNHFTGVQAQVSFDRTFNRTQKRKIICYFLRQNFGGCLRTNSLFLLFYPAQSSYAFVYCVINILTSGLKIFGLLLFEDNLCLSISIETGCLASNARWRSGDFCRIDQCLRIRR